MQTPKIKNQHDDFYCKCTKPTKSYPNGYTAHWVCNICGKYGLDEFDNLLKKEEENE